MYDEDFSDFCGDFANFDGDSVAKRYYDRYRNTYRVETAIYDRFPIVSRNFERREVEINIYPVIYKVYCDDKNAGLQILLWIVEHFQAAICKGIFHTDHTISEMICCDKKTESDVILKYIYEHPEFEKIVLGMQSDASKTGISWYCRDYLYYLCKQQDLERIQSSYRTLLNNPNLDKKEFQKAILLNHTIFYLKLNGVRRVNKKLYDFFKLEIASIGIPVKIDYLMGKLNFEVQSEAAKEVYDDSPNPATSPENKDDIFNQTLKVMGVWYVDDEILERVSVGDKVTFVPEPENEYDKNAVLVQDAEGNKLGYIPRQKNRQLLFDMAAFGAYGVVNFTGSIEKSIVIDVWLQAKKR